MTSFKGLTETKETINSELKSLVKDDKQFNKLKNEYKKDQENFVEFLDYFYVTYEEEMNSLMKKYKIDEEGIIKELEKL